MMARRQGQAYSQDLRDRVFALVDGGMAVIAAATLLKVDRSYIYKVLARRRLTGETSARPQRCQITPKLAPFHEAIRARVVARSDMTIEELRAWLLAEHGVSSSVGGLWTTLDRLGLTYKKRPAGRRSRSGPTLPSRERLGASASRI
jgi:transposase